MKHSNFYAMTNAVQNLEIKELRKAIQAHGGSYEWNEDADKPIVAANPNSINPEPLDVVITQVYLEDGVICIIGHDKETDEPVDFKPSDIFVGHISFIIDYIPDVDSIQDVTTSPHSVSEKYVIVEFPEDSTYFENHDIGYPCYESEDNGARYVSEEDYISVFGHKPNPGLLYKIVQWPESQELMEDENFEEYSECVYDEKGMNDFICPAYWVPASIYKN